MLDISRMQFPEDFFQQMSSQMSKVFEQIEQMEKGSIANPDEHRMVGHYWLRNAALAPTPEITQEILQTLNDINGFVQKVHDGELRTEKRDIFRNILLIGIGGSGLGPQFISAALGTPDDRMHLYFIDNTDPDGMDRVFTRLEPVLDATLCIVISRAAEQLKQETECLRLSPSIRRII